MVDSQDEARHDSRSTRLGKFLLKTDMITKIIATAVLLFTLSLIVDLKKDDIHLVAILAGIAGSAATFLFAPKSK